MNKPKVDRTVVAALGLIVCLMLAALTGRMGANDQQSQTELLLLVQQVSQGTALVVAESRGLLRDSQALSAVQQANDHNIAAFQLLTNGSVKRNLPAAEAFIGALPDGVSAQFADFQTTVSELIQSRTVLERILRGRDALIQSTERLAAQSESLADALEQQGHSLEHLRAAYRIKTILFTHSQAVRQAYADGTGAPPLALDSLRDDLQALSTHGNAPSSPSIRRTAANLLAQLQEHQQSLGALEEHNQASVRLQSLLVGVQKNAQTLQQQLELVSSELYRYQPIPLYLALVLGLASLGLAGWLGYLLRDRQQLPVTVDTSALAPATHPERTSPGFMTQLKTEKNLLMNDIKPMGEGILYIKADEHLEATGDLARCLNQSREALVRRIDQLKRQALELQAALDAPAATLLPDTEPVQNTTTTPEKSALIDLTFKGHAELDGLQRHLRQQPGLDKEESKQLLVRCLKAERVLDEIRVRLKKSDEASNPSALASHPAQTTALPAFDKVQTLVSRLVENLDELQTQPAKGRRARNIIP